MIQVVKTAPDSQLLNLLEYDFLSETQKQFSDIYSFQEIILSENLPHTGLFVNDALTMASPCSFYTNQQTAAYKKNQRLQSYWYD